MTKRFNRTLLTVLGLTLALGGCSKEDKSADDKSAEDKQAANDQAAAQVDPEPAAKADPPAGAEHFASAIMVSYETCRSLLASDTTEGIDGCTAGITEAAKGAHAQAPAAAHGPIGAVEKAAAALAAVPADDIAAVRQSFGELSKSVIAMLDAAPEVASQYHIFECPMVKGYGRWTQPDAELANPYMGSSMLSCGSEIK